jgi:hypothetical protein
MLMGFFPAAIPQPQAVRGAKLCFYHYYIHTISVLKNKKKNKRKGKRPAKSHANG